MFVSTEPLFLAQLRTQDAILVSVHSHRGSVPREAGAWMAVFADNTVGTVGGGHLEWQAMAEARVRLGCAPGEPLVRYALGPTLGQCCGGEVVLKFEPVSAADMPRLQAAFAQARADWPHIALFGGGHVARALVHTLAPLPLRVRWVDSRDEVFPTTLPTNVSAEHADPVQSAVADVVPGALVLVMSFSHAEDLDVVTACLARQRAQADLPFIGLIGSRTKWASFSHRLLARGYAPAELAQVTCPIGLPGITGKAPEVIAVAVAAQLLQVISQRTS
ncbi:xanthine dehydrogenase accessory protein XdhC [Rhodoferax sp.]|uniref:xanthine dehydrogenase accessory protein XdhC n=1 Tax=Rhodoferax sp. TaxID=50421 RepID=UPI002637E6DB|nr:xanthine dehydrogenase accessory protein XdhC [Rhodoferax sp.]MDD2808751.1 xanthine dehydrogenase accessory protein XdhC [Rhodoferax sp.]MDD4943929.1 xanthine dehydrogenase accessory protein XdhC [Rhodoferax sp.]